MTRQEKETIVAGLTERFAAHDHFYVIDTTGLTVAEINDFRRSCFKEGVTYQVAKNTLIKRALHETEKDVDYAPFSEQVLKGFSGVIFSKESGNIPAKIIKDSQLTLLKLKGASIDGELFVGPEHLEALSKLKSKTELIGEVMTLLQSPMMQLVSSLQSGNNKLSGVLKALSAKKES